MISWFKLKIKLALNFDYLNNWKAKYNKDELNH